MRLGGYFGAGNAEELTAIIPNLDMYGLSAVPVYGLDEMTNEQAIEMKTVAKENDIILGESWFGENIMHPDENEWQIIKTLLRKSLKVADVLELKCIFTITGSNTPEFHSVIPENYSTEFKQKLKNRIEEIFDGLNLKTTKLAFEPWYTSFFWGYKDVVEFMEFADNGNIALHLDMMNMILPRDYTDTTKVINETFDAVEKYIVSVHLKDLMWDTSHMYLKIDEVHIGDGVLDYDTYLNRLSKLDSNIACFCEHFSEEKDYALNFARLHKIAKDNNLSFKKRNI